MEDRPMHDDVHWLGASRLLDLYRRRELSPVEVARSLLDRVEDLDGHFGAFRLVDPDATLAQARRSEARYRHLERVGLLDGLPVAIKDSFPTRGWSTCFGSRAVDTRREWGRDGPTISSLRRQNAVFMGKTTMSEFGWKAVTDSPLTGVSRNPWNTDRTPGGSSGGSGVALAAGFCPLAIGSDIGGSARIPAAFCNVVGLKPTQELAPLRDDIKSGLLLHAGVMARTVEDIALAMDVMTEWHPSSAARPQSAESYTEAFAEDVEGLRVASSPGLGLFELDPGVESAVREVGRTLEQLGAWVSEVDPGIEDPTEIYTDLLLPSLTMEVDAVDPSRHDRMDPGLLEAADEGRRLGAVRYAEALQRRRGLIAELGRLQQHYDVLITATVPVPPFEAGLEVPRGWPHDRWWTWTPLTFPFNVTGQPALSVPAGFTDEGLPIGVQFVAGRHQERVILKAAHAYQRANPTFTRHPPSVSRG